MIIFGTALALKFVPEALPAVVTISLVIGIQRVAIGGCGIIMDLCLRRF